MRALFVVNEVAELIPSMTTARMAVAAADSDVETWVAELGALGIDTEGELTLRARRAPRSLEGLGALADAPSLSLRLDDDDVVLVRLNPARFGTPQQIELTLFLLGLAGRRGVRVINSAESLERTATKAFLSELPNDLRPTQAVAANVEDALTAIGRMGPVVVVKPVRGTRGVGVTKLDAAASDPRPTLDALMSSGPIVVQALLPNAEAGDKRIVMVDGRPLEVDGHVVAVRRVPAEGELRSNLHAGGRPEATTLSETERALVMDLGPHLDDAGLRVAGVDVLADKVLEINVWAPGGLGPFEKTTGIDAAPALVTALLGAG